MGWILFWIDLVIYFITLITVLYLFVFALYALKKRPKVFKTAKRKNRIAVLFPAYKADGMILESVQTFLLQDYPSELYDVVVIADQMEKSTVDALSELPVVLLEVDYQNSSKAKAMNYALDRLPENTYDIAVVLDADNTTDSDFLKEINDAFCSGIKAMQAHRMAKNRDTDTAVLDAVSEEINNSIFRKGHVNLGFSSALIGSGMAFEYGWFRTNMKQVSSMGEDKELEILLLRQGVYIDYLEHVNVYDQKTQRSAMFYNQRRRWMSAQFETLSRTLRYLPSALAARNFDYCNKIVQWTMFPRSIILVIIVGMTLLMLVVDWVHAIKWLALLLLMMFTLSIATPDYLVDAKFYRAIRKLPLLALMMVVNLLRLKGAGKTFIHTDHNVN